MKQTTQELPPDIESGDLAYPRFEWTKANAARPENKVVDQFEIWYTERFGWCIPTLDIRSAPRGRNVTRRTYAFSIGDQQVVSIGMGPHVLRHHEVYVTEASRKRLQKFLDLKTQGQGKAGEIRDRISTRRSRTIERFSRGGW